MADLRQPREQIEAEGKLVEEEEAEEECKEADKLKTCRSIHTRDKRLNIIRIKEESLEIRLSFMETCFLSTKETMKIDCKLTI